jgi:hypothetical protein
MHLRGERENPPPPVLKNPRQCPPVLLAEAILRKGKALGNENGKILRYIYLYISCVSHRGPNIEHSKIL